MSLKSLLAAIALLPAASYGMDSIDFGVGGGYRQDRLSWAVFDNQGLNALDMKYENLRSAEVEGYIKGIYKYIYLHLYADYGWIISGKNKTGFLFDPNLNPNMPVDGVGGTFRFSIPVHGRLEDGEAALGVAIPLWEKDSTYGYIIPFGGICSHRQLIRYKTPDPKTSSIDVIPPGIPFSAASFTPSFTRFSSIWWGTLLGASLDLRPIDSFELEIGYSRLFLKHKQKQDLKADVHLLAPGFDILETLALTTKSKFHNVHGHLVRGKMAYYIFPFWKISLMGSFLHAKTKTKRKLNLTESIAIPDFNFQSSFHTLLNTKAKWAMFDIVFESGFVF